MRRTLNLLLGLMVILCCQLLGQFLHERFELKVPAAIVGMLLLLLFLLLGKNHSHATVQAGHRLLRLLPLFFIPAGAGIVLYRDIIAHEYLAIGAALLIGTPLAFVITLLLFNQFDRSTSCRKGRDQ